MNTPGRERTALGANILTATGTFARVACGVGKTKLAASLLGVSGLGVIGIAGQVQQLGITWGSLSLGAGFSQCYAAALGSGDVLGRKKLLSTTFTTLVATLLFTMLVFCLAAGILGEYFFGSSAQATMLFALAAALPFQVMIGIYFQGILIGHGLLAEWSRANMYGAIAELGFSAVGMLAGGVKGVFWGTAIGAAVWFALLLSSVLSVERPRDLFAFSLDRVFFRKLIASGACSLATGTFAYGSGIFLRTQLLRNFGADWAGAFHAAALLSMLYTQFLVNGIWAHLFPIASGAATEKKMRETLVTSINVTAGLALMAEIFLLLSPERMITLVFHGGFTHASLFLSAQLGGDYLFLIAQPFVAVLLARRRLWAYGLISCTYYAVLALAVAIHWPASPSFVYAVAYGVSSLMMVLASSRACGLGGISGRVAFGGVGACLLAYASTGDSPAFLAARALLSVALGILSVKLTFGDTPPEKISAAKLRALNAIRIFPRRARAPVQELGELAPISAEVSSSSAFTLSNGS
jgi:O-antigen/teichoic acid export membrane protein